MEYTLLGSTGIVVSRIALGSMTFTAGNRSVPSLAKVGPALADEMVGRALDVGINFFDTADRYNGGESEIVLGAALKPHRNNVVITTKVGARSGALVHQAGLSRSHIFRSVDESLRRLGTDWIDGYIVHRDDPYTPLEETLSALDAVVRSGKVRYLGFSNWSAWRVAAAVEIQRANHLAAFTHGQLYYSLLGRDVEADIIPMLQRYGLGLTVWSPLASGVLTGKYASQPVTNAEHRHAAMPFLPIDHGMAPLLLEKLREIAEKHHSTPAQIALAWLLEHPAVTSIILGASNLGQLESNVGAVSVRLLTAERSELNAITELPSRYPNWFAEMGADRVVAELIKPKQRSPQQRGGI